MNTNQPITEGLLGKFLAHETDAVESATVENWLKQDIAHQKELDDYYFIWDVRNHGILAGVTSQYMEWCGRFAATFAMG